MAVTGVLVACAVGRPAGGAYVASGKGYRVVPPAGWERIESRADAAWRHPAGAGLMAHGTCEGKAPRRPLAVLARHLRFGLRDVRLLAEQPVEVGGQHGVRVRFSARLDGAPVAVDAVTLVGRGCAYDLVVVAPADGLDGVAPEFEAFVGSFGLVGETP